MADGAALAATAALPGGVASVVLYLSYFDSSHPSEATASSSAAVIVVLIAGSLPGYPAYRAFLRSASGTRPKVPSMFAAVQAAVAKAAAACARLGGSILSRVSFALWW